MTTTAQHVKWMRKALELGRLGQGMTRPNPPVGAVIVKNGKLVGDGYHHKAGTPHAEIHALRAARTNAKNATLYVTLEPCCTHGRTGPCTQAIIGAKIRTVVIGTRDPNLRHRGKGVQALKAAGIAVIENVCRDEARALIAPFQKWVLERRPYVTLKLAISLDGRIADSKGDSKWISGPAARQLVHERRRHADAVLVGLGTVLQDDPQLRPRPARGRRPLRVVLDEKGETPLSARILNDNHVGDTIVATTKQCSEKRRQVFLNKGAQVAVLPSRRGVVNLDRLMKELAARNVLSVFCEGGGEVAASLIRGNLVDEYLFFTAPKIIGGCKARPSVGGRGWRIADCPELDILAVERLGRDIMISAKPGRKRNKRSR